MDSVFFFGTWLWGFYMGVWSVLNSIFVYNLVYKRTQNSFIAAMSSMCLVAAIVLVAAGITLKHFGR